MRRITRAECMSFAVLSDFLKTTADCWRGDAEASKSDFAQDVAVVVEAGWLNKSNWHVRVGDNHGQIAIKGYAVGRNHEVGRKIVEIAEYAGFTTHRVKPLRKLWRGNDRKITAEEIKTITGYAKRTNQDVRDAILLAWVEAGLSIKL